MWWCWPRSASRPRCQTCPRACSTPSRGATSSPRRGYKACTARLRRAGGGQVRVVDSDSEPDDAADADENERLAERAERLQDAYAAGSRPSGGASRATPPSKPQPAPPPEPTPRLRERSAARAEVLASGVAWSPSRVRARRRAPRQCTDVLFALLALTLLGCFAALSAVAFSAGDQARLRAAYDYGSDLCGQPNAHLPLLDHRLIAPGGGAAAHASFVPRGADRSGRPLLFVADPARHLGLCVRACSASADPADGFEAGMLLCTDACASASAAEKVRQLGACCFPAYASEAEGGYCVPAASVSVASLDAASRRAGRSAASFWPTDAALDALRAALRTPGRRFANEVADVRAAAGATVGCVCRALGLSLAFAFVFARAPVSTLGVALAVALTALACVSGVLWASGEAIMRASASGTAEYDYGYSLSVCGYVAFAVTCVGALLAVCAARALLGRTGALMQSVSRALREAPGLHLLPLLGVLGSTLVLLWWFYVATHLVSAGQLAISAEGFPLATFDSTITRFVAGHALLGACLLLVLQHAIRMVASGVVCAHYFGAAPSLAGSPAADDASTPTPTPSRPMGMSQAAMARAPRPFDWAMQPPTRQAVGVCAVVRLVLRYHAGTVVLGAVLSLLLWPLRPILWLLRPCRLSAGACARATSLDWAHALSADAYVHAVALCQNYGPAARSAWSELVGQPAVARVQLTVDLCFYSIKLAVSTLAAAAAGLALSPSSGTGTVRYSSSLLLPMSWTFALFYLAVSQLVIVFEALLTGLLVSFCMDSARNPPELWHALDTLLRALGVGAAAKPRVESDYPADDEEANVGTGALFRACASPLSAAARSSVFFTVSRQRQILLAQAPSSSSRLALSSRARDGVSPPLGLIDGGGGGQPNPHAADCVHSRSYL
mmetsp:Transcript_32212/g.80198  ORF Transcript_32212/g.80198 Transcript_32212/m.80198 type:complete len:900 (-) Transcript_32212:30-2729(-)